MKSNEANPAISKAAPAWEELVSETQCAIDKPRQVLIRTDAELDRTWKESQSGIDIGLSKPKVDFSRKWVIAGFLGMVSTSGHKLEIQSVEAGPSVTVIVLRHTRPGPGCMTAQVIEFPCFFASIDHFSPATVEFKTVLVDTKCE